MANDQRLDYATPMPLRKGPGCLTWVLLVLAVVIGMFLLLALLYGVRSAPRVIAPAPVPVTTSPAGQ